MATRTCSGTIPTPALRANVNAENSSVAGSLPRLQGLPLGRAAAGLVALCLLLGGFGNAANQCDIRGKAVAQHAIDCLQVVVQNRFEQLSGHGTKLGRGRWRMGAVEAAKRFDIISLRS